MSTPRKYSLTSETIPVSAIVVGLNEGHLLQDCLESISFCAERIYVDLGSVDNSKEIALGLNFQVLDHEIVPIGEYIVAEMVGGLAHDWIMFVDPDERLTLKLQETVRYLFQANKVPATTGAVSVPWKFYFKNRALIGTPWGGVKSRPLIANRKRFTFTTQVHRGRNLLDGFDYLYLEPADNVGEVTHLWSDSWRHLVAKHIRYLELEGQSHYEAGKRTTAITAFLSLPRIMWNTITTKKPFSDGPRGLALSLLWVTYKTLSQWALFLYQQSR